MLSTLRRIAGRNQMRWYALRFSRIVISSSAPEESACGTECQSTSRQQSAGAGTHSKPRQRLAAPTWQRPASMQSLVSHSRGPSNE